MLIAINERLLALMAWSRAAMAMAVLHDVVRTPTSFGGPVTAARMTLTPKFTRYRPRRRVFGAPRPEPVHALRCGMPVHRGLRRTAQIDATETAFDFSLSI
jgi:hypothetical protein